MRRGDRWRAGGLALLVGLMLSGRPAASVEPATSARDAAGPKLVPLAPGTTVDGRPSGGWTDRIIHSIPRLASGEIGTLPESAKTTATLFRTAVLVEVGKGRRGYELHAVGAGNGVPFRGREVVVTPDGPAEVRASLSTVERIVANAAYDEVNRGRLAVTTPTFALMRGPARLAIDGVHKHVDLYYAILVDPETGAVRTLNWATLPGKTDPPRRLTELPHDLAFDCPIDVAVDGKIGPLNVSWSFAMAALPPGRKVEVTPELARLVESTAGGRGDAGALEKALRGLLDTPASR
jgi:hypothetical protein